MSPQSPIDPGRPVADDVLGAAILAITGSSSEDEILRAIDAHTRRMLPQVDRLSVALLAEDPAFARSLGAGPHTPDGTPFPLAGTALAVAAASAAPQRWTTAAGGGFREADDLRAQGIASVMNAPMLAGEGVVGVLSVGSRAEGVWADADLGVLAQLAALAGGCLERLRLLTRLREAAARLSVHASRLEVLGDVGHRLSSATSEREVLRLAAEAARAIVPEPRVTYASRCEDGESVAVQAIDGSAAVTLASVAPAAGTAVGRAITTAEPLVVGDLSASTHPDHAGLARLGLRGAIHLPVEDTGEAIGCLSVAWAAADVVTRDILGPLEALARLVGSTLGRVRAQDRAATSLREDRARIRQVIDLVPHAIVARDQESRFVLANRTAAEVVGLSREELEGRTVREIGLDPGEAERVAAEDRRVLADGEAIHDRDDTIVAADGRTMCVTTTTIPFTLAGTSEPAVLSVQVDVTERLEFERHLAASEARARALIDDAPLLLITLDAEGRIGRVSRFGAMRLGYSAEDLVGTLFAYLHPEEGRAAVRSRLRRLVRGDEAILVEECRMLHRDGHDVWARQTGRAASGDDDDAEILIVCEDITEERSLGERLAHHASHDALTGLVNRREFDRRLADLVARVEGGGPAACLCFIDIDHFKIINDTCGHRAGDQFLREIVRPLRRVMRATDTLARIGGDEFGLLLEGCEEPEGRKVAERLRQAIEDFEFQWQGRRFGVSLSIGLACLAGDLDAAAAMTAADAACYTAKDLGRNRIEVAPPTGHDIGARRGAAEWVARTRAALAEERLVLYAQPIVPVREPDDLLRFEVLVRMIDTDGTLIPPGAFIPAAERFGLIDQIDQWVIDHTISRLAASPAALDRIGLCTINVSVRSLESEQFLGRLVDLLSASHLPGSLLGFEITETAAVSRIEPAQRFVETLSGFGCRFGLDDFGSGFSSFGHLKRFGANFLKVDGSLIRDIANDPTDRAVVQAIQHLADAMGMQTIAEFVESAAMLGELREIGVDFAQGFGVGRPVPLGELLAEPDDLSWLSEAFADDQSSAA